eukprot:5460843-Karenia_brevis.AAC.1
MCAGLPPLDGNCYDEDCLLRVPERCNWTLAFIYGRMPTETKQHSGDMLSARHVRGPCHEVAFNF